MRLPVAAWPEWQGENTHPPGVTRCQKVGHYYGEQIQDGI